MICSVVINSLEITLILQLARNDVKIGPARARGNRLWDSGNSNSDQPNLTHL